MAGVKARLVTNLLTMYADYNEKVLVRMTPAAEHGILIYRCQVDIDPNGRSAAKVAQIILKKVHATDGTMIAKDVDNDGTGEHLRLSKIDNDPETLQTVCHVFKNASGHVNPGSLSPIPIIDSRQVTVGGTGITTVIFSFPRGLKIDESVGFAVAFDDGAASAFAKLTVVIDFEE